MEKDPVSELVHRPADASLAFHYPVQSLSNLKVKQSLISLSHRERRRSKRAYIRSIRLFLDDMRTKQTLPSKKQKSSFNFEPADQALRYLEFIR